MCLELQVVGAARFEGALVVDAVLALVALDNCLVYRH